MLKVSEKEVEECLGSDFVFQAVKSIYEDHVAGEIFPGNRIFFDLDKDNTGQWLVANSSKKGYFGCKFSSVFPNNPGKDLPSVISTIYLYSGETGQELAQIQANYLTAVKTAGNAALATDLYARKDAKVLGVIGTGFQAFSQVKAIQEIRDLEKVYVSDLDEDRVKNFIKMIEEIKNRDYEIIPASSNEECVENSDIVCTCTTASKPVFDGEAVKPGTHINAIGSFTANIQEIDVTTVKKASKIVTEHLSGLWEAAGDILIPLEKGEITKDVVTGDLGQAVVGQIPLRENDQEVTINESVGSGVLDIGLAIEVYQALKEG